MGHDSPIGTDIIVFTIQFQEILNFKGKPEDGNAERRLFKLTSTTIRVPLTLRYNLIV
jgi:hypothetical protein